MARYVIKETSIATEANTAYKPGTIVTHYIKKDGFVAKTPEYIFEDDCWKRKAYADRAAANYIKGFNEHYKTYPFWTSFFVVIDLDENKSRQTDYKQI